MKFKFLNYFLFSSTFIFLFACEKDLSASKKVPPPNTITFTIDSVYNESETATLFLDKNGYYHMPLNDKKFSTNSRIKSTILVNGKANTMPSPATFYVSWETDHYWTFKSGDLVPTIIKTNYNPTKKLFSRIDANVIASYSSNIFTILKEYKQLTYFSDGNMDILFTPIYNMKGDTVIVEGKVNYTIEVPVDNLFSRIQTDSIQKAIKFILE
jgi:hypothetical protein